MDSYSSASFRTCQLTCLKRVRPAFKYKTCVTCLPTQNLCESRLINTVTKSFRVDTSSGQNSEKSWTPYSWWWGGLLPPPQEPISSSAFSGSDLHSSTKLVSSCVTRLPTQNLRGSRLINTVTESRLCDGNDPFRIFSWLAVCLF